MVEEMYQQETKEEEGTQDNQNNNSNSAQTPTPATTTGQRSEFNELENDPSLIAINTQCFSENHDTNNTINNNNNKHSLTPPSSAITTANNEVAPPPPIPQSSFPMTHVIDDTYRRGNNMVAAANDYGTPSSGATGDHMGSSPTLIRYGATTAGDVSLTLGLRHAGNMPENTASSFSVRDFGGC